MLDIVPGAAAGEGDPPTALRLPGLRGGGGAGAGAGAAGHRRHGDRGAARARAGRQVRRSPAACIARRRSSPAKGSSSTARPCATGWAGPAGGWSRCGASCAGTSWARPRSSPTTPRCRCSTPAGAGPRPGGCGATRSTTGPGAGAPRRRWSTSTPRTARASARPRTWPASGACCRSTATAGFKSLLEDRPPGEIRLAFCWAHCRRCFYEIHQATGSPHGGGGAAPDRRALRGRGGDPRPPGRGATRGPAGAQPADRGGPARLAHGPAGAGLGQVRPGGGDPLRPAPLGRAGAVPRGWPVELDTNTVERAIRPIALGRKNSLFAGSMAGRATGRSWPAWWRPRSSTGSSPWRG